LIYDQHCQTKSTSLRWPNTLITSYLVTKITNSFLLRYSASYCYPTVIAHLKTEKLLSVSFVCERDKASCGGVTYLEDTNAHLNCPLSCILRVSFIGTLVLHRWEFRAFPWKLPFLSAFQFFCRQERDILSKTTTVGFYIEPKSL